MVDWSLQDMHLLMKGQSNFDGCTVFVITMLFIISHGIIVLIMQMMMEYNLYIIVFLSD